ncbi:MAG: M48 family metallopeptidase [Planctomycetota bacterium]
MLFDWSPDCAGVGSIIPLLLALMVLEMHSGQPTPTGSVWIPAAWAGGLLVAWLIVAECVARILLRSGSRTWLSRWEYLAQGLCLGILVWLCQHQAWATTVPGHAAALAPWLLCQIILWGTLAPTLSALSGASWTRAGLILHHLRFELAPALIILPVLDLCELIGERTGIMQWFSGPDGFLLGMLGAGVTLILFLSLLPGFISLLWGAQELPNDTLRKTLQDDCARAGMPDVRLRVWSSPGGEVHNAVALGVVPGLRWILISEDLLRDLSSEHVRAVVAHELGHHRHRHLVTYMWFALVTNVMLWAVLSFLVGTMDANGHRPSHQVLNLFGDNHCGVLFLLPGMERVDPEIVFWGTSALLVILVWRGLFGYLSRACEREADIHGAWLTSPAAMAGALVAVARLSGTPEKAPSWRHRSIHSRSLFLRDLVREPHLAALHKHHVNSMRLALITALILILVGSANFWFDPIHKARTTLDPDGQVTTMAATDAELSSGLAAADAGNTGPLISWLARAEPADRQRLAALHLRMTEISGGAQQNGTILPPDDRSGWRIRYRLAALSAVPMEDEFNLGLEIDNLLAYSLVAGSSSPSKQDIELASGLIPRLESALAAHPDHNVFDTLACVHFLAQRWEAARGAWDKALVQLRQSESLSPTTRAAIEQLYRSRYDAAIKNLSVNTSGQPGPFRPLPLGFSPDAAEDTNHEHPR